MKKCLLVLIMFSAALYIGCGDDDGGGNGPTTKTPRVEANTTVAGDLTADAQAAAWNSVDSLVVDVSAGNPPAKIVPSQALSYASEINVKAVHRDDTLFLWLQWDDTTKNIWTDRYEVTSVVPLIFSRSVTEHEDQMYVMFDGAPGGGWDVWNWRLLTTGAGGFAEGFTWDGSALTTDANGTGATLKIQFENRQVIAESPEYSFPDTNRFDWPVLLLGEAISREDPIVRGEGDTTFWHQTTGWQIGHMLPGWLIDNSLAGRSDQELGSRWDTRSVSEYNAPLDRYTLVLYRKMNTGFAEDVNLAGVDSVKVRLGVLNNQEDFTTGSSNRGFSEEFWIIF